jgi:hypothetical protein
MPQTKRKALTEDIAYQPQAAAGRDLERVKQLLAQGIVENVKILGWKSKNRRRYLPEGIDPALYDRKPCNLNHPPIQNPRDQAEVNRAVSASRDATGVFGETRDPYKNDEGVFAKQFWFNVDHPYAKTFSRFVLEAPHLVGFSPAHFGNSYHDGREDVVELVDEVRSVDLVGSSATTRGLLEAEDCAYMEDDEDTEGQSVEDTPIDDALSDELAGDDLGDELAEEDASADTAEDGEYAGGEGSSIDITPEMFQALTKCCQAYLDGTIDEASALKKIKHLFRTHAALAEAIMPLDIPLPKNAEEAAKVLAKAKIKNKSLRVAAKMVLLENDGFRTRDALTAKKNRAVALCEAASLPKEAVSEVFLESLLGCKDEAAMQRLIEDRRTIVGTGKSKAPRSAGQTAMTEGEIGELRGQNGDKSPEDLDKDRDARLSAFEKRYRVATRN